MRTIHCVDSTPLVKATRALLNICPRKIGGADGALAEIAERPRRSRIGGFVVDDLIRMHRHRVEAWLHVANGTHTVGDHFAFRADLKAVAAAAHRKVAPYVLPDRP